MLASAIISFSRDTGIDLVAEGVETASEQDTLTRLGVPYGQGYLFSRPVSVADFVWTRQRLLEAAAQVDAAAEPDWSI